MPSALVALGRGGGGHADGLDRGRVSGRPAVTGWEAAKVLGAGLFLIVGYLTSVMAMRQGDIGLVAPFRYTSLLWAIVLGLLVFGDLPDVWTLIGAAIVVGAGLFTCGAKRRLRAATPANTGRCTNGAELGSAACCNLCADGARMGADRSGCLC